MPDQFIKTNNLLECRHTIGRLQNAAESAGSYITNIIPLYMISINCSGNQVIQMNYTIVENILIIILDLKVQLANRATRLANKLLEAYALDVRESNQGNYTFIYYIIQISKNNK